jgi:glycosyltransferase involved in cell wall biosynthesis
MALRLAALDRVDQLGAAPADEVREMFVTARVVVVPSLASPNAEATAIEAAMCGRPLVVSDEPGLAGFVTSSAAGILTAGRDAAAVADAVSRLLGDDCLADDLGARGARYAAEHHSTAGGVAAVRSLYRDLAGCQPR